MKEIGKHTTVTRCDNVVIIKIKGVFKFDAHTEFRKVYKSNLNDNEAIEFVIDLSMAEYIDSSALGMLLIFREEISQQKNSTIKIINTSPGVKKILEIANFGKLFDIE